MYLVRNRPFLRINKYSIARPYLPITVTNPENNLSVNMFATLDNRGRRMLDTGILCRYTGP